MKNLLIQSNVIDACYEFGVTRLLFLGLQLYLSKAVPAAHSRRVFADRPAGGDESPVCGGEDCWH